MKKGLSVLLIVAALFGFYGGASSLTDVLACKDYWEKEGEKSTADMNKLEDGLNQLGENEQAYLDGVQKLAENEPKLEEGKQTLAQGEADYAAAPAKLRAGEAKLAAGKAAYKDGKAQYDAGKKALAEGKATLATLISKLDQLKAGYGEWTTGMATADASIKDLANDPKATPQEKAYYSQGIKILQDENGTVTSEKAEGFVQASKQKIANTINHSPMRSGLDHDVTINSVNDDLDTLITKAKPEKIEVQGQVIDNPLHPYLDTLVDTQAKNKQTEQLPKLPAGRIYMQTEIGKLLKQLSTDEENLKKIGGKEGVKGIQEGLAGSDEDFSNTVAKLIKLADGLVDESKATIAAGEKQLKAAEKELAAGAKKIKSGEAELAQGYADYEAAPAKLAAGRQQLADGLKQLEEGKKQLAQYEDGEQQVRDGLATLMSTEPNGGLESILDRRGGDDQFDDANGHLDVQEGLDAVKVGRGYQADSGELITKEITNRAVGTAAGLGAAVLACLAALLSLIKKYKGAAVSAVLAAIAGVAGAVIGSGAGSEFSDIAGSTVGNLPWIAAGVTAAVACVFAIVNFTAKAE